MHYRQFFTKYQLHQMIKDFRVLLKSPEAPSVVIEYHTRLDKTEEASVNSVYKFEQNDTKKITLKFKCVQKIIGNPDHEMQDFRILKEGDSVFFFEGELNLNKLDGKNESIEDSIVITDFAKRRWVSRTKESEEINRIFKLSLGNNPFATIIACSLLREET
jgi:hypothetical protein